MTMVKVINLKPIKILYSTSNEALPLFYCLLDEISSGPEVKNSGICYGIESINVIQMLVIVYEELLLKQKVCENGMS